MCLRVVRPQGEGGAGVAFGVDKTSLLHHRQRQVAVDPSGFGAESHRVSKQGFGFVYVIADLAGGAKVERGVGVAGIDAKRGAEGVFRLGNIALRVVDEAEVVQGISVFGLEMQRLALAGQCFVWPSQRQDNEAEVHPGFGEARIEGDSAVVKRFGFLHAIMAVEVKAIVVLGSCFGEVHAPSSRWNYILDKTS